MTSANVLCDVIEISLSFLAVAVVMASSSKRRRSSDFSPEETKILVECFVTNLDVLSAKHSITITNRRKKELYETIISKVNAVGGNGRGIESVKDKWVIKIC